MKNAPGVLAAIVFAASANAADPSTPVAIAISGWTGFAPLTLAREAGIFKKHGLDVEISSFGGDARLMQALTADGVDIALGGGPAFNCHSPASLPFRGRKFRLQQLDGGSEK